MSDTRFRAALKGNIAEVYLYDEIGMNPWTGEGIRPKEFAEEIDRLVSQGARELKVRINSPGGNVMDGVAIYSAIRRFPGVKTTVVDGIAASMASVIAMAGDTVEMASGSMMMIHEPWGGIRGTADQMRAEAEILDKLGSSIQDVYHKKTGLPAATILEMMQHNSGDGTWMTSEEAVAKKFADLVVFDNGPTTEQGSVFVDTLFKWSAALSEKNYKNAPVQAAFLLSRGIPRDEPADQSRATPPPAEKVAVMNEEEKKALEAKIRAELVAEAEIRAKVQSEFAAAEKAKAEMVPVNDASAEVVRQAAQKDADPDFGRFTPRAFRQLGRPISPEREARSDEWAAHAVENLPANASPEVVNQTRCVASSLEVGRLCAAVVFARMNQGMSHSEAADFLGYRSTAERIHRASGGMMVGDATAGGVAVPTDVQQKWIDSLKAVVVVRSQIPQSQIIMSDRPTLQMPRLTSAFAAEFVGEASAGSTGEQKLSTDMVSLSAKKMRIEALVSRELLRVPSAQIDSMITAQLAIAGGLKEDWALVEGTGGNNQPRGLLSFSGSALAAGATDLSYINVDADLESLMANLNEGNIPRQLGRAWVAAEKHRTGLRAVYNNFQLFPFRDELDRQQLKGFPAGFSTQFATDGANSCLYHWAPGASIFFEYLAQMIELSNTYTNSSGTTISADSKDCAVIRYWRQFDFALTHDEAVSHLSTVKLGGAGA